MSIEKIKEILKKNISDKVKVFEINRLLNEEIILNLSGPKHDYADLIVDKGKIYKLREQLPADRKITRLEILSICYRGVDCQLPENCLFVNPDNDLISNNVCRTTYCEEQAIDFKLIFGFNIKAIRILLLNEDEITDYPVFKIRIHLEDKPCNSSNVS